MAETNEVSCKVRCRRWNWLGHVLRREGVKDCFTVLRQRGRSKTTCRSCVQTDIEVVMTVEEPTVT